MYKINTRPNEELLPNGVVWGRGSPPYQVKIIANKKPRDIIDEKIKLG
jgi:hypothetical protein